MQSFQSLLSSYDPKPLIDYLSPVGLFWLGTQAGQRLAGGLLGRYFGGPRAGVAGLAVVAASSVATQKIKHEYIDPWLGKQQRRQRIGTSELLHRTYLSMMCFMVLGMKSFDTVLPSSVIMLGSFAKTRSIPFWPKGAVDTDSHVASPSERARIQRLGKAYGCHHCGSKQIFTAKPFIADHMPPTMQVKQMNKVWWRRFLGFKVKQALWPQCQSCFSLQGSAVRMSQHELIYNMKLRPHHFSVALALAIADSDIARDVTRPLVKATEQAINFIDEEIRNFKR